jgi:hypothetical protein
MTYVLRRGHTFWVINSEIPLVQGGNRETGLSLFLWQAGILKISNSPAGELK